MALIRWSYVAAVVVAAALVNVGIEIGRGGSGRTTIAVLVAVLTIPWLLAGAANITERVRRVALFRDGFVSSTGFVLLCIGAGFAAATAPENSAASWGELAGLSAAVFAFVISPLPHRATRFPGNLHHVFFSLLSRVVAAFAVTAGAAFAAMQLRPHFGFWVVTVAVLVAAASLTVLVRSLTRGLEKQDRG